MKVFLSWSGDLSHKVALSLREWIPSVLPFVKAYVSSEDIDKGSKWLTNIVHELESTYYGVLCVTPGNLNAPWLVFEAGALTKAVERNRVTPLLFGLKSNEISGPIAQFQAAQITQGDILKLILSINRSAKEDEQIKEELAEKIFRKWWPDLNAHFEDLSKEFAEQIVPKKQISEQERILSEILRLTKIQTNLLQSPEDILPPDYVEKVLSIKKHVLPRLNFEVCDAAEELEKAYSKLRQTIRGEKGLPSRTKEPLVIAADALRDPIDRILSETARWKKAE